MTSVCSLSAIPQQNKTNEHSQAQQKQETIGSIAFFSVSTYFFNNASGVDQCVLQTTQISQLVLNIHSTHVKHRLPVPPGPQLLACNAPAHACGKLDLASSVWVIKFTAAAHVTKGFSSPSSSPSNPLSEGLLTISASSAPGKAGLF